MQLDLRIRADAHDRLLNSRLDALIPMLMDRAGLDAWVLAAREYNEDPVVQSMLPATWLDTARRRTILLFLRAPDGVRRMAVARYAVGDAFPSAWDPEAQPDQWSRLAELLADADPARIGVNSSAVFPLADGLSASERAELVDHLPPALASRIVSAETAAIGWLETRLSEERALLADACRQSHAYLRRALSTEVITSGTTTTADVEWWLRDAVHDDGYGSWFHPTCTVQRRGGAARDSFAGKEAETVIGAGDLVHVVIGDISNPENLKKFETAKKYLEQIASDMDPSYLKAFARVFTWIVNNIYNGLDVDMNSLKKVKEWARKGPIVYVPCHKSHMDYMILSYILYQNWMGVPFIAAGANLSFFPLGILFRKSGAFFLKRTFKGNKLYSQTFAAYLRTLLSEKIPIEFFIEGTRSRSGKLALPKLGLLSMLVDSWKEGTTKKDIIFVPVYIGYDLVVEEDAYAMEMKGGKKEKENISQLIKAGRILRRRYGKVYVRFSEPFSLRDFTKGNDAVQKSGADQDIITRELSWEILGSINNKTVGTSTSVLAAALMSRKGAIDETDAINLFNIYTDYLRSFKYDMSDSLKDTGRAFSEASALLQGRGLVSIDKNEDEPAIYEVDNDSRIHMAYYKNNIINCLVPLAIISNIILKLSGIPKKTLEDEYNRIKNLFSKEFSIKKDAFEDTVDYMIEKKMLRKHWGNISLEKDMTQLLSDFAGLITDYLESYLVVFTSIKKLSGTKDIFKAFESTG